MVNCELCGKETELQKANVEEVIVHVCPNCIKYGTPIQEKKQIFITPSQREDIIEDLREDYAKIIKQQRTEQGLSQKEFAQKLSQKESFISKIEQGSLHPTLEVAKKIERILGVSLTTRILNSKLSKETSPEVFTLGDLLKKKN